MDWPQLKTCCYSHYRPDMGVPLQTSLGTPKWVSYGLVKFMPIAPSGYMLNKSHSEYQALYLDRLDRYSQEVELGFRNVADLYPGQDLVILCFENLSRPNAWCHRTMFAKWWEGRTGEQVVEVGPHPPHPTHQQLSLL
jgi:hypothetical protein